MSFGVAETITQALTLGGLSTGLSGLVYKCMHCFVFPVLWKAGFNYLCPCGLGSTVVHHVICQTHPSKMCRANTNLFIKIAQPNLKGFRFVMLFCLFLVLLSAHFNEGIFLKCLPCCSFY